jgi:hypothetical protein
LEAYPAARDFAASQVKSPQDSKKPQRGAAEKAPPVGAQAILKQSPGFYTSFTLHKRRLQRRQESFFPCAARRRSFQPS